MNPHGSYENGTYYIKNLQTPAASSHDKITHNNGQVAQV